MNNTEQELFNRVKTHLLNQGAAEASQDQVFMVCIIMPLRVKVCSRMFDY
jgi:hypothetical protein